VWVYLHSNFCGGLRNTHLFCNRVHIGRSRSSKVVDIGTNRKGICDLLVSNSNFGVWSYLALFLRYCDLFAENCEFFPPHSYLTPSLGVTPFEFMDDFFISKIGLSVVEHYVILACVFFTQCQRSLSASVWQTDGQTCRRWLVLGLRSYADAL